MNKQWTCPKCKRKFENKGQIHSCRSYPLANHFINKQDSKKLFNELVRQIKKKVGPFETDSLECCIHLVGSYCFACVYILKDRIRVSFVADHPVKNKRLNRSKKISTKLYYNNVDIESKKEMDQQLFKWLKKAYNLKK